MEKIFECQKCGAHHLASNWEDKTIKLCSLAHENSIYYCPTCQEASAVGEIDLMSNLYERRFWPYYIDKNEILDQYPEMAKWL